MNVQVPDAFIFMKVGPQGSETLEEILERKKREFEREGKIYWGYGGWTCNPITQVQPFAEKWRGKQRSIHILMSPLYKSGAKAGPWATKQSIDGKNWKSIPSGIQTAGQHALVLGEIEKVHVPFLHLEEFEVGIGKSCGKNAAEFIKAQNDKGCLVRRELKDTAGIDPSVVPVLFQAELLAPYAVFLR